MSLQLLLIKIENLQNDMTNMKFNFQNETNNMKLNFQNEINSLKLQNQTLQNEINIMKANTVIERKTFTRRIAHDNTPELTTESPPATTSINENPPMQPQPQPQLPKQKPKLIDYLNTFEVENHDKFCRYKSIQEEMSNQIKTINDFYNVGNPLNKAKELLVRSWIEIKSLFVASIKKREQLSQRKTVYGCMY